MVHGDDHESFSSLESPASDVEIRQFNPEVFGERMREDDLMATRALTRAVSQRSTTGSSISSGITTVNIQQLEEEEPQLKRSTSSFARRRDSVVESLKRLPTIQQISKFSWWDDDFKRQRLKVYATFLQNYLILSVILAFVLSVYWGSYYRRDTRYVNLKMLVVNQDEEVDGITPIIGNALNLTAHVPSVAQVGGWDLYNYTEFNAVAAQHNNTVVQEIRRQVHHQKYWAAIYVLPNATNLLYTAITENQPLNVSDNLVQSYYESGRDFIAMSNYVIRFLGVFQSGYQEVIKTQFPQFIQQLPSPESRTEALQYIMQPMYFNMTDGVPAQGPILLAPLNLGLTYLIIFAFFQMVMTIRIQVYLATIVTGPKYVFLRMGISQISYIITALAYVLLNIAFQIEHTNTFGKSGALVLWAISYLTMSSLGSLNECVAIMCFLYYPPLIGAWLVSLMVLNIAPTVSPMALTNHFYRYGYAMPVHNSYEAVKVVFSDIYKGNMGRNIGILVAWIVVSNCLLPFVMMHASKTMKKRAQMSAT